MEGGFRGEWGVVDEGWRRFFREGGNLGRGTRWWCWNLAAGSGWRDRRAFWVKQGRYRGTGGTGRCAGWNYPRAESLSRIGGGVGEKSGKKWFGGPLGVAAGGGGPRENLFSAVRGGCRTR